MARGPAQNPRKLRNCPETGVWWGLGGNGHVQTHPRDHTIHLGRGIPPHLDVGTISQAKPCFSDSWLWTPKPILGPTNLEPKLFQNIVWIIWDPNLGVLGPAQTLAPGPGPLSIPWSHDPMAADSRNTLPLLEEKVPLV